MQGFDTMQDQASTIFEALRLVHIIGPQMVGGFHIK